MLSRTLARSLLICVLVVPDFLGATAREIEAHLHLGVSAAARTALGIAVEPIEAGDAFTGAEAAATVIAPPGRLHATTSPFAGILIEPRVMVGVEIERGAPIAVLHSMEFAAARAELEARTIEVEHAEHVASRLSKMRKEGLVSEHESDEARIALRTARVERDAAAEQLTNVRSAAGPPGSFELLAPASGVVSRVHVDSGERVDAAGPVVSVFTGQEYWASAQISTRVVDLLEVGADVRVDGGHDRGRVVAIDPSVDPRTRSVEVFVSLPDEGPWRLGRIVELSFDASAPEGTVSLPATALVGLHEDDVVFVEVESGFEMRRVEMVVRSRNRILARGDLVRGERVAVSGLAALKNMVENP